MISPYTSPLLQIPPQLIPYKQKIAKNKKWAKETVDGLENLGRRQYHENVRFLENYQMLNGQFIGHHYFHQEGYTDMLTALSQEFEIPSTLRHYDIMGKVVNNLTEKLAEIPDVFRVQEMFEEDDTNEFVRAQSDLMHQSVKADINNEIRAALIASGFDPDKQDFASQEEAQQYQQEMQQMAQAKTPAQIDKFMKTDWKSQAEIWGAHQLTVDRERYKLDELERTEFKDMLITDRCFRHFYLTGDGFEQETWNPINTFFHASPDVEWTDEGDYVGRIFYASKSEIVNKYAWKMTSKQLLKLEDLDGNWSKNNVDMSGFPTKVYAPFEDFKAYNQISNAMGYDPINNLPLVGGDMLNMISGKAPFLNYATGLYRVSEVYWMSQRKVGKVVYIDPTTGVLAKDLVDETFIPPDNFAVKEGDFYGGDELNTVYWTYTNETWKGTKISYAAGEDDAIYLDLNPLEFQFKGDYTISGARLPVCGRIFNNRNAQSMSLVDFMKPHQIGHNVCMNQLYQLLEKETGKFVVWDAQFFNTMKDWGGEDSYDKIQMIAKELGHVFGDTSPQNMKGANPGNQLPKVMDMEQTAQMLNRAKLAEFFENRAMAQVGISPQFAADVKSTETATGINTAVSQTQLNVQRYYTDFFQYKKRTLTMDLDIAQYVQSRKKDVTISYTKSDNSRVFLQMTGTDLLLRNMHVYVVNSQQLLRTLEQIRAFFLQNNTSTASPSDLVEVMTSNSVENIKAALKESWSKLQDQKDQQMQQQQQGIQAQQQIAANKDATARDMEHERNETKKEVAYIQTFNRQPDNLADKNNDNAPDVLEYNKLNQAITNNNNKATAQRESNAIRRDKINTDLSVKNRELDIKEKALKVKAKESQNAVKIAKVNK